MQPSTEVLDWVILFYDKSKTLITRSEAKTFFQADKGDSLILPRLNRRIAFSSISQVMEAEDYFQEHPKERPPRIKEFKNDNFKSAWNAAKTTDHIKAMKKGMMNYVNRECKGKISFEVQALLNKCDKRLRMVKQPTP